MQRQTRFGSLTFVLSLSIIGCSSAPGADEGDLDARQGCAHVADDLCDESCDKPDPDCYLAFEGHDDAAAWFDGFEAKLAEEQLRGPRAVLPETDSLYEGSRADIHRGWEAYTKQTGIDNLPEPRVLIIEDATPNAFVVYDSFLEKNPLTIMLCSGLLETPGITPTEMLAMSMHELEHLIMGHQRPGATLFKEEMRVYYFASAEHEPLGYEQVDDADAREVVTTWTALAEQVGAWPVPELDGLPATKPNGTPVFSRVLVDLLTTRAAASDADPSCAEAKTAFKLWGEFLFAHVSHIDERLQLDEDASAELSAKSAALIAPLATCLADDQRSMAEIFGGAFGFTPEEAAEQWGPSFEEDREAFESAGNVVHGIRAITERRYEVMRLIPEVAPFVRYYSEEEAADDRSVRVLHDLGLESDAIGSFTRKLALTAAEQDECRALIEGGTVPPYGELSDPHHAPCWRAFHAGAMKEHINRQE
jgi:hypothetical protein